MTSFIGQIVGRYLLREHLGTGMCSNVYLATIADDQTNACEKYAIKVMSKQTIDTLQLGKYARREVSILKKANHPNVVKFKEAMQSDTHLFIIMDYVPGVELTNLVHTSSLSEHEARIYIAQLVHALVYLHARRIVHRDLKPDNVLVHPETKQLTLIDFGLTGIAKKHAVMKTNCGSPFYSAPEVAFANAPAYDGVKADAWSLGVLTYILLTASHPFVDSQGTLLSHALTHGVIPYPPGLSKQALDFLRSLLNVDPRLRSSVTQIALHPWLHSYYVKLESKTVSQSPRLSAPVSSLSYGNLTSSFSQSQSNEDSCPRLSSPRRSSHRRISNSFSWFRSGRPSTSSVVNETPTKQSQQTLPLRRQRGSIDQRNNRVTLDYLAVNRKDLGEPYKPSSRRPPSLCARTRALFLRPSLISQDIPS